MSWNISPSTVHGLLRLFQAPSILQSSCKQGVCGVSFLCTTNLNNLESFKRIRCQNCIYISRKKTGDLLIYYDSRRRISFQQLQFNIISVQKCMFHPKASEASPRRSEHTLETARSFEAPEKIAATEQKYDQISQGKKCFSSFE